MSLPEPPVNVRVVLDDNSEHPVECVYRGIDEAGRHVWVATTTWPGIPAGVACDELPAHTAIVVEFEP